MSEKNGQQAEHDINAKESGFGIGELGRVPSGETPAPHRSLKGQNCHYCGCPATGWGFFDEPVCEDCGG